MSKIVRVLATTAVMAAGAVALAGTASAEPVSGNYNGLMTDGSGQVLNPAPVPMSFAPCGPDCVSLSTPSGQSLELRLNGPNYVGGYNWQGTPCTQVLDPNALILTDECPGDPIQRFALTKA